MVRKATKNPKDIPCRIPSCPVTFTGMFARKRHYEAQHEGKSKFPCPWPSCVRRFPQKQNMIIHHRIHTGEKPYPCPICFKNFNSGSGRSHHLETHRKQTGIQLTAMVNEGDLSEDLPPSQFEDDTVVGSLSPKQEFYSPLPASHPPLNYEDMGCNNPLPAEHPPLNYENMECDALVTSLEQVSSDEDNPPPLYEEVAVEASPAPPPAQERRWLAPPFIKAFWWIDDPLYIPIIPPASAVLHFISQMPDE